MIFNDEDIGDIRRKAHSLEQSGYSRDVAIKFLELYYFARIAEALEEIVNEPTEDDYDPCE